MTCPKCSGLMVQDYCEEAEVRVRYWHCIQCSTYLYEPDTPILCSYQGCHRTALRNSVMCARHDKKMKHRGVEAQTQKKDYWTLPQKQRVSQILRGKHATRNTHVAS